MARTFDTGELDLVRRTAVDAHRLTSSFYGVTPREWQALPYDIVTAADEGEPALDRLPDDVLASVVRVDLPRRPGDGHQLYRILVHDPRLRQAAGRGPGLEPLLRYVLTHELVHVVRFGLLRARFEVADHERDAEEARVHALTARVLEPAMESGLERVVAAYRPLRAGA
jgi:hypothetical protein